MSRNYCSRCLKSFGAQDPRRCTRPSCRSPRPETGWPEFLSMGERIDERYEVEEILGVGGAGITYRCADLAIGEQVAIKLLHADRQFGVLAHRLAIEGELLELLDHPHIVPFRGMSLGSPAYLATAHMPGGSLEALVRRTGPLPPAAVVAVGRQLALALQYVHAGGIVHRDLKPGNVLLQSDDLHAPQVRLADFGIARLFRTTRPMHSITRTGAFIGTPEYAAPEQVRGEKGVGPAADAFALGVLLHFLASGRGLRSRREIEDWEEFRSRESDPSERPRLRPLGLTAEERNLLAELDAVVDALMSRNPARRLDLADAALRLGARPRDLAPEESEPLHPPTLVSAHEDGFPELDEPVRIDALVPLEALVPSEPEDEDDGDPEEASHGPAFMDAGLAGFAAALAEREERAARNLLRALGPSAGRRSAATPEPTDPARLGEDRGFGGAAGGLPPRGETDDALDAQGELPFPPSEPPTLSDLVPLLQDLDELPPEESAEEPTVLRTVVRLAVDAETQPLLRPVPAAPASPAVALSPASARPADEEVVWPPPSVARRRRAVLALAALLLLSATALAWPGAAERLVGPETVAAWRASDGVGPAAFRFGRGLLEPAAATWAARRSPLAGTVAAAVEPEPDRDVRPVPVANVAAPAEDPAPRQRVTDPTRRTRTAPSAAPSRGPTRAPLERAAGAKVRAKQAARKPAERPVAEKESARIASPAPRVVRPRPGLVAVAPAEPPAAGPTPAPEPTSRTRLERLGSSDLVTEYRRRGIALPDEVEAAVREFDQDEAGRSVRLAEEVARTAEVARRLDEIIERNRRRERTVAAVTETPLAERAELPPDDRSWAESAPGEGPGEERRSFWVEWFDAIRAGPPAPGARVQSR